MAESTTVVKTPQAPAAIGPYSQAIRSGDFLFCSGQIPLDPTTMQLEPAEIKAQTLRVLKNLTAVLSAGSSSWKTVLKTTVFLSKMDDFSAFNEVYEGFLKEQGCQTFPARSTVEVSKLPRSSLIEIEAIARCS